MRKFNQFKRQNVKRVPRSSWNKSHEFLYTGHFGVIQPVDWQALQPGENYKIREGSKMLSVPYFAPMFSKIHNKTRYFAVPIRKLVPYWEKFCTQVPDDGIVEPYTTLGDVFVSAYVGVGPLATGNKLVLQSIQPGGLAEMIGWPWFMDQLYIITTGFDIQGYNRLLAQYPTMADVFNQSSWGEIQSMLLAASADHEGFEHFLDDPDSSPYFAVTVHEFNGDPEKPGWVKIESVDVRNFFSQRLRLLPFLAYQKVIYDWFVDLRFLDDQFTLTNPYFENTPYVSFNSVYHVADEDAVSHVGYDVRMLPFLLSSRVVDYAKDYFTTCATQPQVGPDIVIGPSKLDLFYSVLSEGVGNESALVGPSDLVSTGDEGELYLTSHEGGGSAIGKIWAEVNEADEITPIKLRWQMALQSIGEIANVSGNRRYTDYVYGQFGIRVPDPYMQRSFLLGGWTQSLGTQEIVALADGSDGEGNSSMLADQGGFGRSYARGMPMRARIANEHVVVMALNYIVPQNYYTQGLPTKCTDIEKLDWPHHQFAKVGEQPVFDREVFYGLEPDHIFGYNRRYSDKTDARDQVHGEFLSTLEYWRTGRKFLSQPYLGSGFLPLRGDDGHNRVLAVEPSVAEPFRMIRYQSIEHVINIPRT